MRDENLGLAEKLVVFGEMLARQRKKKGVKQKDLAEACNISQRAQSAYERGEVAPKVDYLFKLQAQGYDIQSLIASGGMYELDNREKTIIDLYRNSPVEVQMSVLEVLAAQAANPTGNVTQNSNQAMIAGIQSNKTTNIKK